MSQLDEALTVYTKEGTLKAIMLAVIGFTGYAFADTISKWLTQSYSVSEVIFCSSLFGMLLSFFWMLNKSGWQGFFPKTLKWHTLRALVVCLSVYCIINALALIPLADFYGIVFTTPMITAILSALILKETIGKHRLLAIIAGFAGVLMIAGPQFNTLNTGVFLTLIGALCVSFNAIIIRKIGHEKNIALYSFYPFLANTLCFAPTALGSFTLPDATDAFLMAAISPLVMAGMICCALGFARAPSTAIIAPFHYSQILWGILFGFLLFGDIPALMTIWGASLIIAAGIYLIWRESLSKDIIVEQPVIEEL